MGKSGQYDVTVHSSFRVTTKTKERKKDVLLDRSDL